MIMGKTRLIIALIVSVASLTTEGFAQVTGQASLGYKLTVLGEDANGVSVLQAGDIFTLKSGGILGVAPGKITCAATVQAGVLHKPSAFCSALIKDYSAFFQPGLKVYVDKIEVNLKKAQISVRPVACDSCNGTEPPLKITFTGGKVFDVQ